MQYFGSCKNTQNIYLYKSPNNPKYTVIHPKTDKKQVKQPKKRTFSREILV
jgi:hypothetical protein